MQPPAAALKLLDQKAKEERHAFREDADAGYINGRSKLHNAKLKRKSDTNEIRQHLKRNTALYLAAVCNNEAAAAAAEAAARMGDYCCLLSLVAASRVVAAIAATVAAIAAAAAGLLPLLLLPRLLARSSTLFL
ncbi:hypothetical protein ACSSS7_005022 [Eimeria intestinalis]